MEQKGTRIKNKLASRFRNINAIFIVIILITVSAVSFAMVSRLSDNASRDYVRFYTKEAMSLLSMLLNNECMLVSHQANDNDIIAWFLDEDNPGLKQTAHEKLMHYAGMLQINGVYFVIDNSLNEYARASGTPLDMFKPINTLDPELLYDSWYFETLESEFDFTLNLDIDKVSDTARMWINYKVIYDGKPIGVTCSALQFDDVFEEIFGVYDDNSVRGLIIDHNGFVQIDSAMPDPTLLTTGMETLDDIDKPHILDLIDYDDIFVSAINRHLDEIKPHSDVRIEPEVLKLSNGLYMSIAPIVSTNWLKVTFYDSGSLYNSMNLLTPLLVVTIAFVFYIITSTMLINRLVFKPLNSLTRSLSVSENDSSKLFGLGRDDEIGELARETKHSWDHLNDRTKELRDTAMQLEIAVLEATSANAAKSTFLANMSHEIRTPMNALLGLTEILIEHEDLPDEIEEGLEKMYNSCDLLLGIINDILDFSKIEAGRLDIIPAQYNVASMINDSAQLNIMRINEKPIDFDLQIDESIPAKLIGDELRLKQILNNLLSNAFKYTEKGTVTLSLTSEVIRNSQGIILTISIRDTGHGMSKEQLGKIFDEYSRFDHKTNHTIEGTGLGLAITQSLISLMGGEIHVESKPGFGSLFVVRIPQQTVSSEVLGKELTENLQRFRENYITGRKRSHIKRDPMPYGSVLIVDDVETNLYVAVGLMKLYKLQIETATGGREALDLVTSGKKYDVIFMDHMMPDMDGIETTAKLRELGYTAPIVALTANAVVGQADMFLNNGFDEFISKPIDIRQLDTLLNILIRDKQPPEIIENARKQSLNTSSKSDEGTQQKQVLIDSFLRDAGRAVPIIESMLQKNTTAADGDFKNFTTAVHGMKSSLSNIGEPGLSEIAYTLENAGKAHDTDKINEVSPRFLEDLSKSISKLSSLKVTDDNKQEISIAADINVFKSIADFCSLYNRKGVLDLLAGIKPYPDESKAVLDSIEEFIHAGDFEAAQEIATAEARKLSED